MEKKLSENARESYFKAGKILSQIREEARNKIKIGVSLLKIAEFVEHRTIELGADGCAFPCNISLNDEAAHATPKIDDDKVFSEDIVKLDLGVHVNGYIADSAITIDLSGKYTNLVKASEDALYAAIDIVKNGINTADIGGKIEETITEHGFKPVVNLTGHGVDQYLAHTNPSVPNKRMDHGSFLQTGDVIAIEPFATDGIGKISEGSWSEIFSVVANKPVRLPAARQLMKELEPYRMLPFAKRWLKTDKVDFALMQLSKAEIIHSYPVLKEVSGGMVSQAEHTMIVTEDGCEVTTL